MTTPSGYSGSSNDPYGSAGQYPSSDSGSFDKASQPQYEQPAQYPPVGNYSAPGQYQQYPPAGGYPAAGQYGAVAARPGMVTAAAVLAFVVGGLDVVVGLLALLAGSVAAGVVAGLGGILIVFSILVLAIGALYIWSGLMALQGKNAKILTIVAGVATAIQLIYLIMNFTASQLIGLAISIAIIALLLQPQSKDWFRAKGAPTF